MVVGEKGVYVDLTANEIKNRTAGRKETHIIKQNLPKEVYDAMSEEERKQIPIIGGLIVWGYQEPAPQEYKVEEPGNANEDDLPF